MIQFPEKYQLETLEAFQASFGQFVSDKKDAQNQHRKFILEIIYHALKRDPSDSFLRRICCGIFDKQKIENNQNTSKILLDDALMLIDEINKLRALYFKKDKDFQSLCQSLIKLIRKVENLSVKKRFSKLTPYELIKQSYGMLKENAKAIKDKPILTLDDFTEVARKRGGISIGGIYEDKEGNRWQIKEGQNFGSYSSAIEEYVNAKAFRIFLGETAPKMKLVLDSDTRRLYVAAKMIENSETLANFKKSKIPNNPHAALNHVDGFKGLRIYNFANVVMVAMFLGDTDAHQNNMLILTVKNKKGEDIHYIVCKIDHGFSGKAEYSSTLCTIDEYLNLKHLDRIDKIPFEQLIAAISMVANENAEELKMAVERKLDKAKRYNDVSSRPRDLNKLKAKLFDWIDLQSIEFKQILKDLVLDHAVFIGDKNKIQGLISEGENVSRAIYPYYSFNIARETSSTVRTVCLAAEYEQDALKPLLVPKGSI